jgi:hypothetical protein
MAACNERPFTITNSVDTTRQPAVVLMSGHSCYMGIREQDTIYLHIAVNAGEVTGDLEFRSASQEARMGEIRGELNGDTLLAEYKQVINGKASTQDIAFLKNDNGLIEGIGAMQVKNGRLILKNNSIFSFNKTRVLRKIDCNE